jgi:hypothetical protein
MTRTVVAVLVALCFAPTVSATEKLRIAFDVPKLIQAKTASIGFSAVQVVSTSQKPHYTICARLVGDENNGYTMITWLGYQSSCDVERPGRGMSYNQGSLKHCLKSVCRTPSPPVDEIWNLFLVTFNDVLVKNATGLGQFTASKCISGSPSKGFEVTSKTGADLEPAWRYLLSPGPYHYRFKEREGAIVRFRPDSAEKEGVDLALDYFAAVCKQKVPLNGFEFVTQIDTRRIPRSDFIASSGRAMEGTK